MSHRRPSDIITSKPDNLKFPDFSSDVVLSPVSDMAASPRHTNFVFPPNSRDQQRWQPASRQPRSSYTSGWPPNTKRGRQKSLTEAIKSIKDRRGSVSENAAELAEALKAPISPKLVALCGLWYMTSIFSSASSKAILNAFRYPVTLTVVQFAFVSSLCILCSFLASIFPVLKTAIPALKYPIRRPSRELIMTTLPLTAFQIGGHILNSDAMSRIPVSLVHTIKGLSPLFTVLAYRIIFRVNYSLATYLSLVPLTLGVCMACSTDFTANTLGLVYAFGSALTFVSQNIVSKKLFNDAARAEAEGIATNSRTKPDKLNLLCYSSGLAFLFTVPLWLWSEGFGLISEFLTSGTIGLSSRPGALDHGRLTLEFCFNGITHFAQSLVAFILLSMVSPVTYSVASLIKRVFVVTFAIVWFGNAMTTIQASGIALTFLGLYLYDRTNDAARGERRVRMLNARAEPALLPLAEGKKTDSDFNNINGTNVAYGFGPGPGLPLTPTLAQQRSSPSPARGLAARVAGESLSTGGRPRSGSDIVAQRRGSGVQSGQSGGWLPPGSKMEETWSPSEVIGQGRNSGVAA